VPSIIIGFVSSILLFGFRRDKHVDFGLVFKNQSQSQIYIFDALRLAEMYIKIVFDGKTTEWRGYV